MSCGGFSFYGAIGLLLTDKVAWCCCTRLRYNLYTKYIINSIRTTSWSCNHSVVLTCMHTHTSSCLLENGVKMTHTYKHPYPRLIVCTDSHAPRGTFLFHTHRGAFPLYACSVTRNSRTYVTNVEACLLSKDGRIANCTVRYPGVKRPLFRLYIIFLKA